MIALPVRLGITMSGLACLLTVQATALAGQDERKATEINWQVGASKGGWCIQFLMEAEDASDDLARDYRVILARDATGLPPAIARLIQEEPKYADWVPAEVCTYTSESVSIEGRRFDRGNGNQPIATAYWGVAASSADNSGSAEGRWSLRYLGTNSSALRRAMESRTVPIDELEFRIKPVPESTDRELTMKFEGATITYVGNPQPDSGVTPPARTVTGAFMGNNRALWTVSFKLEPTEVTGMSGALRIVGKKKLAKALDHSPIRLLSPMVSGGKGSVAFTR